MEPPADRDRFSRSPGPACITPDSVIDFLHCFEAEALKEDFDLLEPMIDEQAVFRFNDGDFVGRAAIRAAFEKTWRGDPTVQRTRFSFPDIVVLLTDTASAAATCTWHREGCQGELYFHIRGRGTRVLSHDGGRFRIVHEHLSRFPSA